MSRSTVAAIPSFTVKLGQKVAIQPDSLVAAVATESSELTSAIDPRLEADIDALRGKVLRMPRRSEITTPVDELALRSTRLATRGSPRRMRSSRPG